MSRHTNQPEISMKKLIAAAPLLISLAFGAAPVSAVAQSGDWPNRPIRIVLPYPAGGAVDVVLRGVAGRMSELLGQPIVIEAKPGANANIAADTVANAKPDGYTLLASSPYFNINQIVETGRTWKPTDFQAIARYAISPNYVVVGASSPAKTLGDYVQLAKKTPGLQYGSTGAGSTQEMAVKMLSAAAGIRLEPVNYKGAPPILPDLASGLISMSVLAAGNARSLVQAGRLRALASTGSTRDPSTPDVPTLIESGYPIEVISWYGLHAPAGTPQAVVARISGALKQAISEPEVKKALAAAVAEPSFQDTAEFERFLSKELAGWSKAAQSVGKTQ